MRIVFNGPENGVFKPLLESLGRVCVISDVLGFSIVACCSTALMVSLQIA